MNRRAKFLILGLSGIFLIFGLGLYGIYGYLYPFGHRPATLLCMETALREYANDHDGFYPDSDQGALDALRKLYPKYADSFMLSGITGDPIALKSAIDSGESINESMSSWVYFPGINQYDSPDLVILYEKRKGILPNGRRSSTPVYTVLFNYDNSIKLVPVSDWNEFLLEQELLRRKTFEDRH